MNTDHEDYLDNEDNYTIPKEPEKEPETIGCLKYVIAAIIIVIACAIKCTGDPKPDNGEGTMIEYNYR